MKYHFLLELNEKCKTFANQEDLQMSSPNTKCRKDHGISVPFPIFSKALECKIMFYLFHQPSSYFLLHFISNCLTLFPASHCFFFELADLTVCAVAYSIYLPFETLISRSGSVYHFSSANTCLQHRYDS